MCGRFTLMMPWTEIARLLGARSSVHGKPSWNVAPTQLIAILGNGQLGREIVGATWGLEVSWSPRPLINIRSETVGQKAIFRESLAQHRCLIPATGFYEWSEVDGKRKPYHFARPDGMPFVFAGVGQFQPAEGGVTFHVAILTTAASEFMTPFHHRMPVIMPPETWNEWLDCKGTSAEKAVSLLQSASTPELVAVPVSTRVNSPKNDDARLIEPDGQPVKRSTE